MEKYKIDNREWEFRLDPQQFELTKALLADYEDWNKFISSIENYHVNLESLRNTADLIMSLLGKLVHDKLIITFLSYVMVEANQSFSVAQAKQNELLLTKTNFIQIIEIFGKYLKLSVVMHSLQQMQETKGA